MDRITEVARLRIPVGGQQIELQQVELEAGGMSLLRVRIREGHRFTVFDLDRQSAAAWARAMQEWADGRLRSPIAESPA